MAPEGAIALSGVDLRPLLDRAAAHTLHLWRERAEPMGCRRRRQGQCPLPKFLIHGSTLW